jgi:hypothetical protein
MKITGKELIKALRLSQIDCMPEDTTTEKLKKKFALYKYYELKDLGNDNK